MYIPACAFSPLEESEAPNVIAPPAWSVLNSGSICNDPVTLPWVVASQTWPIFIPNLPEKSPPFALDTKSVGIVGVLVKLA